MSNEINREALLKVANLVRPALATAAYIPALTHIMFDGEYATAYNDISAISVRMDTPVERCLPGELLIRALGSFNAENILFQEGKDGALVLKAGRGSLKLATLEKKAFPYEPPEAKGQGIAVDAGILKGIERCLLSVNNDPTHPAQMGVTLDADKEGHAVLFSTDNFTISRYQTSATIKLPGDAPVILPRFFCEQMVALTKAFPEETIKLWLLDGALLAEFGKSAELFSKTPVDLEPLDFPKIVSKHVKLDGLKKSLIDIPAAWESAFSRALLVLQGEDDMATKVQIDKSAIKLLSTSAMGEADDSLPYDAADDDPEDAFHVDPALVMRASKSCALLGFTKHVVILADADAKFVHIIAHCSK